MPRGGAMMIIIYGLLAVGVVMAIVFLFPLTNPGGCREGFEDAMPTPACPKGTNTYIDRNGRTNCCKGDVNGPECSGRVFCSLSEDSEAVPLCSKRIRARRYKGTYPPEFLEFCLRWAKSMPQPDFINIIINILKSILRDVEANPPPKDGGKLVQTLRTFVADQEYYLRNKFLEEIKMYQMNADEQTQVLAEEILYCLDNLMPLTKAYPSFQTNIQKQVQTTICTTK
jgi:hypothetical protein